MKPWAAWDMDEGILRIEPTRKAALAWWMNLQGHSKVWARHTYGPGAYEYKTGYAGDGEDTSGVFIDRVDNLERAGLDPQQVPLYPTSGEPHTRVERDSQISASQQSTSGGTVHE